MAADKATDPDGDEQQPDQLLPDERRRRILEIVETHGRVRVRELAQMVGVTEPTIRKDISDLDRKRLLRRTHGGALALRPSYEPDVSARISHNLESKRAIARACLAEIKDGDAVFFDSGTSITAIAELFLPALLNTGSADSAPRNVNVLTNSLDVARILAPLSGVRHTVLGGQYRPAGGCFVGPLAVEALQQFTLNVAFIGVSGLSESGFTVADLNEAQIKRTAMERARRVVVPMDHTKLGTSDFINLCDLDRVNTIITDQENPHLEQMIARHHVQLVVAEMTADRGGR
jgi:DeoR/GlpR family transcriptional regulator of sugar metabolism